MTPGGHSLWSPHPAPRRLRAGSGGRAYLVGAGPGDPRLITWRGLELVRSCDALLYDRLVSPLLVAEAPAGADRVFVGKSVGDGHHDQRAIEELMIAYACDGYEVVRLKGGDPFVFGRGGEEALALKAAGVPFEVVPGVSSAVAVPAYAGIPVTHRGLASSFAVITGHDAGASPGRWRHLARGVDTLVLLMSVSSLRKVAESLLSAGRDPQDPGAVIGSGTTAAQRVIRAPLAGLADAAERARVRAPATTVVGRVVELAPVLDWFHPAETWTNDARAAASLAAT